MDIICEDKAIIQPLNEDWYGGRVAAINMLRLDLVHPVISGNKWYKLKRNLQAAKDFGATQVLTFGGAYSNHLIATAAAAQAHHMPCIGIVRGLYAQNAPSVTLKTSSDMGMQLVYISTADYSRKTEPGFQQELTDKYGDSFIIPEGGANNEGRMGAADMALLIPGGYTHVCISVGTGTSFIGLRNALCPSTTVLGFAPFKGNNDFNSAIVPHLNNKTNENWHIYTNWHFGGFGKCNNILLQFMNEFYHRHGIPLDMVYNAKMMYGLKEMLSNGVFSKNARILCVHTGGLQGNSSVQDQLDF
ncbi:MAG: 1-aminocyclopropane-1-carboxylate deaminase [Flavipsychrobacter sp.]|nr:1-aminocyclopropane-1-carboxylate deaminase [Flavipsychrobacter sp.]